MGLNELAGQGYRLDEYGGMEGWIRHGVTLSTA